MGQTPYLKELYQNYITELQPHLQGDALTFAQFKELFVPLLQMLDRIELEDDADSGVLYYDLYGEKEQQICMIPVYGFYASSERALTKLFTRLAGELVARKSTHFQVHLYAHDLRAQRTFAMMQFGYMAETGILKIGAATTCRKTSALIRTLSKEEVNQSWKEIWSMMSGILAHLRQAPIFYPCEEFTERAYRAFFLDERTHLHTAFDETGRMIGMIESSADPSEMIRLELHTVSIGEIYVTPEYRGSGLSDDLFNHAHAYEKARGAEYLWVEHGTANPNGRRFWGRYFEHYEYEMDRFIERPK